MHYLIEESRRQVLNMTALALLLTALMLAPATTGLAMEPMQVPAHCARACRDLTSARCATISDDDTVLQDACDACALCVKGEQNTAAWNSSGEFINRVTSIKKRYYMLRLFAKKKFAKVHASSLGLYPRGFVCKPAPCKQSNSTTRRSHEVSAGIMSQTFHPTNNFGVVKLTQAKMKTEGQRCTAAGYVEEGEPNIGTSLAMCG